MDHLLQISDLTKHTLENFIDRAISLKHSKSYPSYPLHTVTNLFYEHSTRTRVSFEVAAKNMQMPVINVDLDRSSEAKGETIGDTISNLAAMGISIFIVRHGEDMMPQKLATLVPQGVHIVNAGDGQHAHPSQALLDVMTIIEKKPDLSRQKVAIVGDIKHSRVANSLIAALSILGVGELCLVAPEIWQPQNIPFGKVDSNLSSINDADVVILLRVQNERIKNEELIDKEEYIKNYQVNQKTLANLKQDHIILHPGPVNRGVEVDVSVVDGISSLIREQVKNGVFMRMTILEALSTL